MDLTECVRPQIMDAVHDAYLAAGLVTEARLRAAYPQIGERIKVRKLRAQDKDSVKGRAFIDRSGLSKGQAIRLNMVISNKPTPAEITPKNGEWLVFEVGGETVFAKSVPYPVQHQGTGQFESIVDGFEGDFCRFLAAAQ